MANFTDVGLEHTHRRRSAEDDICPLQSKSFKTDGDTFVPRLDRKSQTMSSAATGSSSQDKKELQNAAVTGGGQTGDHTVATDTKESSDDELGRLDIDLNKKSKQHNLTSSNVRAILHEVITHEHVVAMMKAAIRDTQDLPLFEPKMTRSRLKQAVHLVQPLDWTLSAVKPPQFVDINLETDEDSSDEEYCPNEEEEDEEDTAEETFLSDGDSLSSPPRMHQLSQHKQLLVDQRTGEPPQGAAGHLLERMTLDPSPPCLLPAADSSFLERLNAVEEELDCSPSYTYSQCLTRKPSAADDEEDEDGGVGSSCLAFRTRSKLPLVDVPLGQLEAELLAPDITDDMYEQSGGRREEDRHWTQWLQGLMAPDDEEEADDDDDPEYNFLDDLDEPDLEDYRTDRAVQITKKEVNELLDELFDTLHEEEEEEQKPEEEEVLLHTGAKFNVPPALRFEAPLASMLTERRRTLRKQIEAQHQKRAPQDATRPLQDQVTPQNHSRPLQDQVTPQDSTRHLQDPLGPQPPTISPVVVLQSPVQPALHLNHSQRLQLQQQLQQHVQLLTQVHLLCRRVDALKQEASITKLYLGELQQFAQKKVFPPSSFGVCNLHWALDLLQEVGQAPEPPAALPPAPPAASRRWLPMMTPRTSSQVFPVLPADTAWLFATRPVFLYPELLPVCNLVHRRQQRSVYTSGENGLIVLGLKHFEGALQSDQLISSYLLCKSHWSVRKHIREMSGRRAPHDNVIKVYMTQRVIPPLPLACSRVQPGDQRPPVDRTVNTPQWLKNNQLIIKKTRLNSNCYPSTLPPGCTLRLHPHVVKPRPSPSPQRRLFTLANNSSLLPLAKAPGDRQVDTQGDRQVDRQLNGQVDRQRDSQVHTKTVSHTVYSSAPCIGQQLVARQQNESPAPLITLTNLVRNPRIPYASSAMKPEYLVLQVMWTPVTPPTAQPTVTSQHASGPQIHQPVRDKPVATQPHPLMEEEESPVSPSSLSPLSSCAGDERDDEEEVEETGGGNEGEGDGAGGDREQGGERADEGGERADEGGEREQGGERADEGGERGQGGEREQGGERADEGGEREQGGDDGGERDKDEDQEQQGEEEEEEEEEEEDFDDLTQDEDEEEVMSSASEESVLSVPELQETMKQLTWLAAERRLCADGDSEEEDQSPTSPGSQEEEEEEEEEEGTKGEESGERRSSKQGGGEEVVSEEGVARGGGQCSGRGRGRTRSLRGLRRSRQERHTKDNARLLLLYDDNILDNDPHRESKDVAFAQSYLDRVREVLQDTPGQVEDFVSLLNQFEQVGDGQEVMSLFRKLQCILGDHTDLLRDFAAFLLPEQALQCGLFEEQQAFERSRRFLRQLEISFGDNPSHYQKIIKALQTGPDLSPSNIHELKAQMETLLKGHTHLQTEFWVFFEELRPPPARPGQFEEAHWPEDGGSDGGEGTPLVSAGGASGGFEEVTLPELEEEEEGHKIQPITSRRQRRKMDSRRTYKDCDWSEKDWPCLCHEAKIRKHRRKGCSRCHGNKSSGGVSRAMKSLNPLYSEMGSTHEEPGDKDLDLKGDSPQPEQSSASWEGSFPLTDDKEEELEEEEEDEDEDEEERKNSETEQSPVVKRSRKEEMQPPSTTTDVSLVTSSSITPNPHDSSISSSSSLLLTACASSALSSSCAPPRPSAPPDLPVCAKNISLTASGEKVVLWTREADRVILTMCQQDGANPNTFQAISALLGSKTPSEVSRRFRDLMRLFRTAARQTSSDDEAPPSELAAANEDEG